MYVHRRDELIANHDELVWLIAHGFPVPEEGLDQLGNVIAPVHASFRADRTREVEGEISRCLFHGVRKVPAIQRLDEATGDLHILLRHRPRSISPNSAET
jgi:hypothetical protein